MALDFPTSPAVCIGATGGSGTRVLGRLLRDLGGYIGSDLNGSCDSGALTPVIDRYARSGQQWLEQDLPPPPAALDDWRGALQRHLDAHADEPFWAWKNPRAMFLLPLSLQLLPDLRFIHVVRDGRDMACSTNRRQYDRHVPDGPGTAGDRARFWSDSNLAVSRFARRHLGRRYAVLRFESLCQDAGACLAALARQLDLPLPDNRAIAPLTPTGIGRHRDLPPGERAAVHAAALPGLTEFGYV